LPCSGYLFCVLYEPSPIGYPAVQHCAVGTLPCSGYLFCVLYEPSPTGYPAVQHCAVGTLPCSGYLFCVLYEPSPTGYPAVQHCAVGTLPCSGYLFCVLNEPGPTAYAAVQHCAVGTLPSNCLPEPQNLAMQQVLLCADPLSYVNYCSVTLQSDENVVVQTLLNKLQINNSGTFLLLCIVYLK